MGRRSLGFFGAVVLLASLATCNGADEAVPPDAPNHALDDAAPEDGALPDAAATDADNTDAGIDAPTDAAVACFNPNDVCANGAQDGMETDLDCGGPSFMGCRRCDNGHHCSTDLDCASARCSQGTCAPYAGVRSYVTCTSDGDCGGNGICSSTTGTGYCRWTCTSAVHCQQLFGPDHQSTVNNFGFMITCEHDVGSALSHCRYEPDVCDSCWDDCNGVDDDGDLRTDEGWFDYQANEMVLCRNGGSCIDGHCLLQCP